MRYLTYKSGILPTESNVYVSGKMKLMVANGDVSNQKKDC